MFKLYQKSLLNVKKNRKHSVFTQNSGFKNQPLYFKGLVFESEFNR